MAKHLCRIAIVMVFILLSAQILCRKLETNGNNHNGNLNINGCQNMTIGIVGNPNPYLDENFTQVKYDKNYINWLNSRNAIAVPISPFISDKELDAVLDKLNGVLLPGGSVMLKPDGKFEKFVNKLIFKIFERNEKGNRIALWGTCQGLEVINLLLAKVKTRGEFFQRVYGMENVTLPTVPYMPNVENWKLGKYLFERNLLGNYTQEAVNCHLHDWSVPLDSYDHGKELSKYLYITSTQKDKNGNSYMDTFEGVEPYNVFGVQFHPDTLTDPKFYFNTFGPQNWAKAVPVSQAIADFFIERSRLSDYCVISDKNRLINFNDFRSSEECNESYFYYDNDKSHKDEAFKCVDTASNKHLKDLGIKSSQN